MPGDFPSDSSGKFTLPGRRLPVGQPRPTLPEGGCSKCATSKSASECICAQGMLCAQELLGYTRLHFVPVSDAISTPPGSMPEINISNSSERDAVVSMESVAVPLRVRWVDVQSRQASNVRILKSTLGHDTDALTKQFGDLDAVSKGIIEGDPEINFEMTGIKMQGTSRVYVDKDQQLVHRVQQFEIVREPDGTEKERRPRQVQPQNVSNELPLKWTGKFLDRADVIRKFIFASKMQLTHINGLTYDFLYAMAKDLEDRDAMMLLGAGPKSNQPLILRRGSVPYRGFLEGRTKGDRYVLLLHLSNMEMKKPEETEA